MSKETNEATSSNREKNQSPEKDAPFDAAAEEKMIESKETSSEKYQEALRLQNERAGSIFEKMSKETDEATSSNEEKNLNPEKDIPFDAAAEEKMIESKETSSEKFQEALRLQNEKTNSIFEKMAKEVNEATSSNTERNSSPAKEVPFDATAEEKMIESKEKSSEKLLEALRLQNARNGSIFGNIANHMTLSYHSDRIVPVVPVEIEQKEEETTSSVVKEVEMEEEEPPEPEPVQRTTRSQSRNARKSNETEAAAVSKRNSRDGGLRSSTRRTVNRKDSQDKLKEKEEKEEKEKEDEDEEEEDEEEEEEEVVGRRNDRGRPMGRVRSVEEDTSFFDCITSIVKGPEAGNKYDKTKSYPLICAKTQEEEEEEKKEEARRKRAKRGGRKRGKRNTRGGAKKRSDSTLEMDNEEDEDAPPVLSPERRAQSAEAEPTVASAPSTSASVNLANRPVMHTPRNVHSARLFSLEDQPGFRPSTRQASQSSQSPSQLEEEAVPVREVRRAIVRPFVHVLPNIPQNQNPQGAGRRVQAELFPLLSRTRQPSTPEQPVQPRAPPRYEYSEAPQDRLKMLLHGDDPDDPINYQENRPELQEQLQHYVDNRQSRRRANSRRRNMDSRSVPEHDEHLPATPPHRTIHPPPGTVLALYNGELHVAPRGLLPPDVSFEEFDYAEQDGEGEYYVVQEEVDYAPVSHSPVPFWMRDLGEPVEPVKLMPESKAFIDEQRWDYMHWTVEELAQFAMKVIPESAISEIIVENIIENDWDGSTIENFITDEKPEELPRGAWMKFISAANGVINYAKEVKYRERKEYYDAQQAEQQEGEGAEAEEVQ
uniref:ELM2 domain-containing protein n=1 Tax=Caenorhabditis tropicalis TaxID=1561998 RepID=A0A1I7UK68_9PELO